MILDYEPAGSDYHLHFVSFACRVDVHFAGNSFIPHCVVFAQRKVLKLQPLW